MKEERNPYAAFPPTLTTEEKAILEKLKEDLNENHLRNLSPISIAKIYVEANLQRRNDVVYALYTDQKDLIRWTKDEDENIPDSDRGSTEQIIKQFNNLENGKFIQTNNNEGYIEFLVSPDADAKSGFKMVKDEDGIWNVAFMPIQ
ncbi:RNA polymerase subunit sigma [Fictibacillus nanhaiensis]|nr:RNA polymerase subunit sigma [Fictibacillus nanhaiensis]